jgi:serine/threonine protein kinase
VAEATPADLAAFLKELPSARSIPLRKATAAVNSSIFPDDVPRCLRDASARVPAGMTILKFGSRAMVGSYPIDGEPVVLKYYEPANFTKHLTYGMLGSRCHRSWVAGLAFGFLGVPTPAPLMVAEWKSLGGLWLSRSFLATHHAAGLSLAKFAADLGEDDPLLHRVAASLREAFAIMAKHRAVHGDLKENNIMVAPDGRISFIDLDATAFLLPEAEWKTLRDRDRRRFRKNWKDTPHLAAVFHNVFDDA